MKRLSGWFVIAMLSVVTSWSYASTGLPLIDAIKNNDAESVRALLAQGLDVNASEPDGATALHWAVQQDNVEVAGLLLAARANPAAATRYNITPLSLASTNGNVAIMELLLNAGVDPDSASHEGQTALMSAARNGNVDAIRLLVERGARVNTREPFRGQTALMWAAGEGNAGAVRLLMELGAEVDAKSEGGFTALLFAVRNGHTDAAVELLKKDANVNEVASDGTSALNMAIVNAYYELAALLLDYGADPNLPDPRGSPLHTLAWLRKPGSTGSAGVGGVAQGPPLPTGRVSALELAKKLLDHGADPNVRISWQERRFVTGGGAIVNNPPGIALGRQVLTWVGATPFYVAANNGDAPLMRVLADGGADPTIPNVAGVTPLMAAAGLNYYEGESPGPYTGTSEQERLAAVELALELGNDIHTRTDFGQYEMTGGPDYTLLYYPLNIDEVAEQVRVGDPRWNGSTALHGAVITGQPSIAQFLIDNGAQVDAKNQLGWTPLMVAGGVFLANARKEYPEVADVLRNAMIERGLLQADRE